MASMMTAWSVNYSPPLGSGAAGAGPLHLVDQPQAGHLMTL
jgi:hypothetical protein